MLTMRAEGQPFNGPALDSEVGPFYVTRRLLLVWSAPSCHLICALPCNARVHVRTAGKEAVLTLGIALGTNSALWCKSDSLPLKARRLPDHV